MRIRDRRIGPRKPVTEPTVTHSVKDLPGICDGIEIRAIDPSEKGNFQPMPPLAAIRTALQRPNVRSSHTDFCTAFHWISLFLLGLCATGAKAVEPLKLRVRPDPALEQSHFTAGIGKDRLLYLGDVGKILRYDGVRWQPIPVSTSGIVRTMATDERGRLWVGGTACFGYLERLSTGEDRFVDLLPQFKGQFNPDDVADIWETRVTPDAVWFQSLYDLFRVDRNGHPTGHWHHDGRLSGFAQVGGRDYVHFRGVGLMVANREKFELAPNGEYFKTFHIHEAATLDNNRMLVLTREPAAVIWSRDGRAEKLDWLSKSDDTRHLVNLTVLDAEHVLATGDDGVLRHIDLANRTVDAYAIGSSFQGTAFLDGNALWVQEAEGLTRMTWPPRWRQIGAVDGLNGDSYAIHPVGRELMVLSSSGVLVASLDERGLPGRFTPRLWTTGEAFDLHSDPHGTLLADSYYLLGVDGDRVTELSGNDLYPRKFIPSRFHPDRLWLGTEHGLAVLNRGSAGWQLGARHRWVSVSVDQVIEKTADTALIGSAGRGIVWARFDADASHILELRELGPADGLDYGAQRVAQLSEFDGGLVVSTARGLFRSTVTDRFVADDVGGLAGLLAPEEMVFLRRAADGRDWAYSARNLFRREPGGSWIREEINSYRHGPFSEPTFGDNGIMIGAAGQLFMLDGSVMSRGTGAAQLLVTGIREHGSALALETPLGLDGPVQELSFTLGFTDYGHATAPHFRARLKGFDEAYGEWRDSAEFHYPALPPGTYRLQAEARDGDGAVYTLAPFDLTVRPRWFERSDVRIAMLALVALLLVAIGVGVTRLRVIHLKARNRELDAIIRARTAELEHANTRLRDQAERDGLTGVANRRRFDVVLAEFQADCRARDLPLALILIDVDHFKAFNDSHGHLRGDALLQNVAQTIAIQCRGRDGIAARYGGEEFALLLRGVDRIGIAELAEKTRAAVAELHEVTVSLGAAVVLPAHGDDSERLIALSDEALYRAKRAGRNRVEVS